MTNIPIEELLPMANKSIYRLVRMASNRAIELADGKPALVENPATDKETTIALEEIRQGKVVCKSFVDIEAAKENKTDHK